MTETNESVETMLIDSKEGNKPSHPHCSLRVALLDTGIFSTCCHIPALLKKPKLIDCVSLWSRTEESVQTLLHGKNGEGGPLTLLPSSVQGYSGEEGLEQILDERTNVEAIIMTLPLDAQPRYVIRVLEMGKRVLSEKPNAATLSESKKLCDWYHQEKRDLTSKLQWSVAENFRYEPAIQRVADAVKNEIR